MTAPPPLTREQLLLLDQYQQSIKAFWQAHDAYRQALDVKNKARAACQAAGLDPTSAYLNPNA